MYVLSQRASRDLVRILDGSEARWGERTAERTEARLLAQFERIGSGAALGHRRPELPADSPIRFVNEPPFVIAFHVHTRVIVRVVHGRRDLARLFRR